MNPERDDHIIRTADINARDVEIHATPLAAAGRSTPELPVPRRGRGAASEALAQRRRRLVKFLLQRGAATSLPDDEAWATPLAWARKLGLADIEQVLQEHGATR